MYLAFGIKLIILGENIRLKFKIPSILVKNGKTNIWLLNIDNYPHFTKINLWSIGLAAKCKYTEN